MHLAYLALTLLDAAIVAFSGVLKIRHDPKVRQRKFSTNIRSSVNESD